MTVRIVSAAEAGDLARLESLARRIFGQGDRAAGWFTRKLSRERVDPELSRLAVDGDIDDPAAWQGYILVGTPPSLHPVARTAGTGVVPEARGFGLGPQLVESAARHVALKGFAGLRLGAKEDLEGFYLRLGFEPIQTDSTILSFGRGADASIEFGSSAVWFSRRERTVAQWLEEAWTDTSAIDRTEIVLPCGRNQLRALISREGQALVAHRIAVNGPASPAEVAETLEALRDRVASGVPLLLLGVNPRGPVIRIMLDLGWSEVQRIRWMERDLRVGQEAIL